jgi:LysM repeat protein
MLDLSKRLLIVLIMGFCIACMFFSVKTVKAEANTSTIMAETKDWVWPAYGEISDHFGTRGGDHHGLDIAAPTGTKTFTVEDGIVSKSYYSSSYGHVIFIKHPNGFESVYAHLSKRLVEEGQEVSKGELIGKIGNTGRSRGAHLHFEVHNGDWNIEKSNSIDPLHALDVAVLIGGKASQALAEKKEAAKIASLEKVFKAQQASDWNISEKTTEQLLSSSVIVSSNEYEEEHIVAVVEKFNNRQKEVNEAKQEENNVVVVDVTKGMTLWKMSQQYNVSIESIKEWNQLASDIILIGQELSIYPD